MHNVVIIGGGPSGLKAGASLAKEGLKSRMLSGNMKDCGRTISKTKFWSDISLENVVRNSTIIKLRLCFESLKMMESFLL